MVSGDVESMGFGPVLTSRQQLRAAAVHVADRVAAEHPHPLDDLMPRLSGRLIADDPAVTAGVLDLLAAIGIRPEQIRNRSAREAS